MSRPCNLQNPILILAALVVLAGSSALAHDPDFTEATNRDQCTFTTTGSNPYFPLWPGYVLEFEGEEEDDEGELEEITATITVLTDTEMVDGVLTRVVEERESEDGEIVEISRNFFAQCRETGDVWYFGEDVSDFEDGVFVGSEGEWRAGVDGAKAGIQLPGTPLLGARYFQEIAPGVALDRGEIIDLDADLTVPFGTFSGLLRVEEGSALDPEDFSEKWYSPGLGLIRDDVLELVGVTLPPCLPDATTLCLNNGRFRITAEWTKPNGDEGVGRAILPSADSGEFYFFRPGNTEMIVKVLNACDEPANSFWVFAAGLTNVEVTLTVTDTESGQVREYENPQGRAFVPILDTSAFMTCP